MNKKNKSKLQANLRHTTELVRLSFRVFMGSFALDKVLSLSNLLSYQSELERYAEVEVEYNSALKEGDRVRAEVAQSKLEKKFAYLQMQVRLGTVMRKQVQYFSGRLTGKYDSLTAFEKEILSQDNRIFKNAPRFYKGMLQQEIDAKNGELDLLVEAAAGDDEARTQIFERMKPLITSLKREYRRLGFLEKEVDGLAYEAIVYAARQMGANRYLSSMNWVVGRVKRTVANSKTDAMTVQGKEQPHENVDIATIQPVRSDTKGEEIWIHDAAERVGVSPSTLRSWDKRKVYKAKWQKKGRKEYRFYTQDDIEVLKIVKEEQARKERHITRDHVTLKQLARFLRLSSRTILRKEKAGILPKTKRDSHNNRIYSCEDVKKIKEILAPRRT